MLIVLVGISVATFKIFGSVFGGGKVSAKNESSLFSPSNLLLAIFNFDGWKRKSADGAKFMPDRELKKVLNPENKGLLIDGKDNRLDLDNSFKHNMIVAPTGAGKTTRYVIPNLLTLDDCSFVVTDPAGELFEKTAGALQAKGFDVQVFAPADPSYSMRYNPLSNIRNYAQIDQLSQTLMRSAFPESSGDDRFWMDGATDVVSMLIRCLMASGRQYTNLGNCLYLLQSWGQQGAGLHVFMDNFADETAEAQFKGLITGNEKTTQGFISTAMTALKSLNDPEMASLLSVNEIHFNQLRERKTALFFILPSNKVKFYSFLMNLFYVDLFDVLTRRLPESVRGAKQPFLPVHLMLDEFGHTSIPEFTTTATTIRKFEVSLSVILQNFTQLMTNYGETEAKTIIEGGFQSKMFYPGLSLETSQQVESMLGRELIHEVKWDGKTQEREQNLMNADRIRTMNDDQAIFLTSNKEAILLQTQRSFENRNFSKQMQKRYKATIQNRRLPAFQRVPLS